MPTLPGVFCTFLSTFPGVLPGFPGVDLAISLSSPTRHAALSCVCVFLPRCLACARVVRACFPSEKQKIP